MDGTSFLSFGLYVATGALVYSSIVPFWFYGGAFIRDKWGYSLQAADALMLFPEGSMVVLSPPIGLGSSTVVVVDVGRGALCAPRLERATPLILSAVTACSDHAFHC